MFIPFSCLAMTRACLVGKLRNPHRLPAPQSRHSRCPAMDKPATLDNVLLTLADHNARATAVRELAKSLHRSGRDTTIVEARLTAELQFIDLLTDQAIDIADAIYGPAA